MSPATAALPQRVAELREAFDRAFARRPADEPATLDDLLCVRVATTPYAIRLRAISGLLVDRAATPLPGAAPDLLGVTGVRGSIVPVYDLGMLLGHPPAGAPRWLVLVDRPARLALAFDGLDGHLRVHSTAIGAAIDQPPDPARRPYAGDLVRTPDGVRALIDVAAVAAAVAARVAAPDPSREG